MAKSKKHAPTSTYRDRRSFAKIPDVMDVPNLIGIQIDSFQWFVTEGLDQAFADISPIENSTKDMAVEFGAHHFGEPLTAEASVIFKEITGGAYDGLLVSDDMELYALSSGRKIAPGALSAGAMEQLYFAFRLAVIRCLWPHEEMPLFFDDSFAMYDSERLEACLNWLSRNYHGQVFLFTCQDREQKTLDKLGISYHLFEL